MYTSNTTGITGGSAERLNVGIQVLGGGLLFEMGGWCVCDHAGVIIKLISLWWPLKSYDFDNPGFSMSPDQVSMIAHSFLFVPFTRTTLDTLRR